MRIVVVSLIIAIGLVGCGDKKVERPQAKEQAVKTATSAPSREEIRRDVCPAVKAFIAKVQSYDAITDAKRKKEKMEDAYTDLAVLLTKWRGDSRLSVNDGVWCDEMQLDAHAVVDYAKMNIRPASIIDDYYKAISKLEGYCR